MLEMGNGRTISAENASITQAKTSDMVGYLRGLNELLLIHENI